MRERLETVSAERELLANQSPAYTINWKMSSSKNKIDIVHINEAQEFVELLEEHSALLLGKFAVFFLFSSHIQDTFD